MSQNIVTDVGNAQIANAIASNTKVSLKYFKVSSDTTLNPDATWTDIPSPILVKDISAWFKASDTEFRLYCNIKETEVATGTNIAIVGAFDTNDNLIFVTKIDPPITVYQDVFVELRYKLAQYENAISFTEIPWDEYEQTMLIQDVLNKYGIQSSDISDLYIALQDLNATVVSLSGNALDIDTHNLSLGSHPHILRALNKYGIFVNPNNFKYFGQNRDENAVFDPSVTSGMLVYRDTDGVYKPAIADGTIKSRVAGYADLTENIVLYTGILDTPFVYPTGTDLYLSMTTPGAFSDKKSPVKVGLSLGGGKILLGNVIAHPENLDDFVQFDDLSYSLLLVDSPFKYVYYDAFKLDSLNVISGSATYSYENTHYQINASPTILETEDVITTSTDTWYRFLVHIEADTLPDVEYSTDSGITWTQINSDEIILNTSGFQKLRLRFTFNSATKFYSFGILYAYSFDYYTSDTRMLETYQMSTDEAPGYEMLLPNNATYTPDGKSLEIFVNGLRLVPGVDYQEIDNRTVKFLIELYKDDIITFTEKYGYVDTSIENWSRMNLEHNSIGEHIFTDLTTGDKFRLAVDKGTLVLIPIP